MAAWLDALAAISGSSEQEILLFEPEPENDTAQIFSSPRVLVIARRSGLEGGWSINRPTEKEPGVPCNLTLPAHQAAVIDLTKKTKPNLVVGSPRAHGPRK